MFLSQLLMLYREVGGIGTRKTLFLVVIVAVGYIGLTQYRHASVSHGPPASVVSTGSSAAESVGVLDARSSGRQIEGQGIVTRLLPDDTVGSRHQRFIVRLPSGQTLLIAHNIDIASRIDSLRVGDTVAFSGEYEWNSQGGVVHWTHHDPGGRHASGWLQHDGQTYQ
jgi:hypothetical protein